MTNKEMETEILDGLKRGLNPGEIGRYTGLGKLKVMNVLDALRRRYGVLTNKELLKAVNQ